MHRPNRDRAFHAASRILLGVAGVVLLALLVIRLPWIASTVGLGYNEGWNAYHAAAVRDGGNLYPDLESTGTGNNYPPTSFVLIGTLARSGGDPIRIGRCLSLLGLFLTLFGVFRIVRRSHTEQRDGAVVAVVVTALPFLTIWRADYLGVNDPQMLAHGVMLTAAALLIGAPDAPRKVVIAAVLMAFAGFIKHNLLPLPLATALAFAATHRWRSFRWFVMAGGGAALLLVAGAILAYGAPFLDSILHSPRTTRLDRAAEIGAPLLAPIAPLLIVAMAASRRASPLVRWYLGLSVLSAAVFLTGEGVRASGVFDVGIATGMAIGVWWSSEPTRRQEAAQLGMLLWVVGLGIQGLREARWSEPWDRIASREAREATVIEAIRAARPPVACHLMHLCYRAGVKWRWDPFNTAQAIKLGLPAGDRLMNQVLTGEFGLIVMAIWPARSNEGIPVILREAIGRSYIVSDSSGPVLLVPRTSLESAKGWDGN